MCVDVAASNDGVAIPRGDRNCFRCHCRAGSISIPTVSRLFLSHGARHNHADLPVCTRRRVTRQFNSTLALMCSP